MIALLPKPSLMPHNADARYDASTFDYAKERSKLWLLDDVRWQLNMNILICSMGWLELGWGGLFDSACDGDGAFGLGWLVGVGVVGGGRGGLFDGACDGGDAFGLGLVGVGGGWGF
ncbi:hypothetical protein Tco_0210553 [Tanacetum coccineum]